MSTETHAESTGPEVVGVDGAGESWVAVALVGERFARAEVFRELPALPRVFPRASVFAIDVPMLLPDDRSRGVDTMLRRRRGVVASTVFSTPPRQALTTADYEAAQAWCRARNLKGCRPARPRSLGVRPPRNREVLPKLRRNLSHDR